MERCRHGHAEHGEVRAGSPVSGLSEGEDNGTVHEQHQTSSRPLCPQTTPAALHSGNRAGDVFELRQFSVDLHPPAASATIESAPSVKSEKRTALQGWWLEGLSLLIAIALLSAISTILAVYNGKRQPSWRYSINLSTIIAVMSTLLRMCLSTAVEAAISQLKWYWHCDPRPLQHLSLFDAASRGPLGSLFLFFRLRSLSVAHLGGLITILSLAIGPFSQQALHSVNCQKPLSHLHPTIRIANSIPDTVDLETDYNLDSVGASAILDAIANSPLNTSSGYTSSAKGTAQVLDGCATGNCTFGNGNGVAYSTIGVCTQCIDATNLIEWVPAWAVSDAGNVTTKIPKLPNGLHIPVISGPNLSAPSIVVQFDDSLEWLPWLPTAPARLKAVSKGPSIIKWTMLTSTSVGCAGRSGGEWDCGYDLGPEDHTPILDFRYVASTCVFYPCTRYYNATVENGNLVENVLADVPAPWYIEETKYGVGVAGLNTTCHIHGSRVELWKAETLTYGNDTFTAHFPDGLTTVVPMNCINIIRDFFDNTIASFLETMLNGTCHIPQNLLEPVSRESVSCTGPPPDSISEHLWWLTGMFNSGNATYGSISSTMGAVADAVTTQLRLLGVDKHTNKSEVVVGRAFQTAICTEFAPWWLAMPATLLLLGAVLLCTVAVQSVRVRYRDQPLWKSDILPLLYAGQGQNLGGPVWSLAELELVATGTVVTLEKTVDGWKYVCE